MNDLPQRSRLLTPLGWVHILLGAYVPVSTFLKYAQDWNLWKRLLEEHRDLSIIDESTTLIAGVLSVVSGWMLIRRSRWTPLVASISGGALVVLTLHWLWSVGPMHVRVVVYGLPTASHWRMGVTYGTELLVMVLQLVSWLVTLGAIYRHRGGTEFPPARFELTTANLWTWIGTSALVTVVFKAWMWVVWWIRTS
jgi:hypothetical protein